MPPNCRQFTLYDRVSKLLESFEWSDCSFLVGNQIIRAHKLILAISSPVFKVMLYGPMAEATEILISDIEPDVFQLLLDFIYKDKVEINTLENACGLLYAAKKYMFPYLVEICHKYIEDTTSINNVLSILNFSDWIQEDNLISHCLTLICKHAHIVLAKDFDHISESCLRKIIQQPSINLSEKELINVAMQWAHTECMERGLIPSDESKRQLLIKCKILPYIRFLALPPEDFNWLITLNLLAEQELLAMKPIMSGDYKTKEEVETYLKNDAGKVLQDSFEGKDNFIFNLITSPRSPLKLDWSYCCRPVIRTANPLRINDISQSIKVRVKCQKTVFINSFSVPSRQSLDCNESLFTYPEHIIVSLFNNVNRSENVSFEYQQNVNYNGTMSIDLPKPFIMNEEEWYTICFSWPGKKSHTYRYPLCYRPTTTFTLVYEAIFTFDDNSENLLPSGSFVEGLKFCI